MRGRLCVGRAAAAAAVAVAVAVPLADGLEGSPGGVRRGSRGTTMVKKRKGRVVIDSDTEDSGSDENLDQVRAGREGAGGRAESVPRELGAGSRSGPGSPLPSARPAPCPDRCCRLLPILPAAPGALGVRPGPGEGAPSTWRLGRGGGAGIGLVGLGLGGPAGSVVCWVQMGAAGCRPGDLGQER